MQVYRSTDTKTVKKQIGKMVVSRLIETGAEICGVFIGFWNPEFTNKNSQLEPAKIPVTFPFNILTMEGVRIPVEQFTTINE